MILQPSANKISKCPGIKKKNFFTSSLVYRILYVMCNNRLVFNNSNGTPCMGQTCKKHPTNPAQGHETKNKEHNKKNCGNFALNYAKMFIFVQNYRLAV